MRKILSIDEEYIESTCVYQRHGLYIICIFEEYIDNVCGSKRCPLEHWYKALFVGSAVFVKIHKERLFRQVISINVVHKILLDSVSLQTLSTNVSYIAVVAMSMLCLLLGYM